MTNDTQEISVQEQKVVKEIHLTAEEIAVREEVLANMTAKTMRRKLFDTLLPFLEDIHELGPQGVKNRAIALVVEYDKVSKHCWCFILMDDKGLVEIGGVSNQRYHDHSLTGEWAWVRDLPVIHVV